MALQNHSSCIHIFFKIFRTARRTTVKLTLLITGAIVVAVLIGFQDDGCLNVRQLSDNYFNRRYFKIRSDDFIYDVASGGERQQEQCVKTRLPLLIRENKKEDVVRCLDSLSMKRNQRPMTIAFIGDSTARQHYMSLTRVSLIGDHDCMMHNYCSFTRLL